MTFSILLAALVLAADPAAELGPNYANASSTAARASNQQWWTRFADPELNNLVRQGTDNNFTVLTAESRIDEADALVAQQLARHKVPRDVTFVDELPRTTTGKLLRRDLTT